MKITGILLILIAILLLANTNSFAQVSSMKAIEQEEMQRAQAVLPNDAEVESSIRQPQAQIAYTSNKPRDPFKELLPSEGKPGVATSAQGQPPALTVQGVVWGGQVPQAIINNSVVTIGDTIEGAEITDIGKNGVIVLFNNATYTLKTASSSQDSASSEK